MTQTKKITISKFENIENAPVNFKYVPKTNLFRDMLSPGKMAKIGHILHPSMKKTRVYIDNSIKAPVGTIKKSWIRDLTRECVESNPGPETIYENRPLLGNGFYEYCFNCENIRLLMEYDQNIVFYRQYCKECEFHIQSDFEDYSMRLREWLYSGEHLGKSFLGRYLNVPHLYEKHINIIEDICILFYHFIQSKHTTDRCVAIVNFCKLRGLKISFMTSLLEISDSLFKAQSDNLTVEDIYANLGFEAQDDDSFRPIRNVLDSYEKMKELPIYRKLHKFFLYLLCTGLLSKFNITFRSLQFDKFEEESIRRTHKPGFDMLHAIIDTITFVCECGVEYFQTGSLDAFTHSGSSYEKWYKTATKLKNQSRFLTNPEPHGFTRFGFISDLKDTIEKGKSIVKFTGGLEKSEKIFLQKILTDLQMIESEELTKRSAQQPRKDPFGILIHGSSNIAKSKLTEIMFKHYGKCFGLPTEDNYRYTRCPTDEYWSGFDSTQWCIVMDDIAFLAPTGEVDPTLKELLQVKNSVPYTPPQAALEDKGRTPVRAELLIATTNTRHLNLFAYFSCPFAIARRLSYVVTPSVKPEFAKNGFMADSSKIPPTEEGDYMNIWNFKVCVPVPETTVEVDNQRTRYEEIHQFEDIHSFLQWYIMAAEDHALSQSKASKAASTMSEAPVCMGCKRVQKHCLCNTDWDHIYAKCSLCDRLKSACICEFSEQVETDDLSWMYRLKLCFYSKIVSGEAFDTPDWLKLCFLQEYAYLRYALFVWSIFLCPLYTLFICIFSCSLYYIYKYFYVILNFLFQWRYGYNWKFLTLLSVCGNSFDTYVLLMRITGEKVRNLKIKQNHLYALAAILVAPSMYLLLKKLWDMYFESKENGKVEKEIVEEYDTQGNVGAIPVPMEKEKKTFYYHDPYAITNLDISGASSCAQGDLLERTLKRNTAVFHFQFPSIGRNCYNTGICIHGNLWITNKHAIKCNFGIVDVILEDTSKNVSSNAMSITFDEGDIRFVENSDVVIIELRGLPPMKSILKYFPMDQPLQGRFKGKYIMKSKSGIISTRPVVNIQSGICPVFGVSAYIGHCDIPTEVGDCGSACIVDVGQSQVIFGTHTSGSRSGGVCMQHISQAMLQKYIQQFKPQVFEGSIPISAPGAERKLTQLHERSCLRFLEEGTVRVYGSFEGYRPLHRSKVEPTYICDYVTQHGYKATFGKPKMNWEPWHLAIKDMTSPIHCYYNSNIKKCEDAFFNDIISKIGSDIKMLEVYSLDVALNGADGVTYVDKINSSTSAGNPFKRSKKHFIQEEFGKIVHLDQVILDRVTEIEKCYENNTRFHPQFCGHLKDEPVSEKKMKNGKTRVFTGGEFAWSIVVRKYLLSHIRLIQNNPFIFEAMPGVVAQSTEWRDLYQFITHFGEDRIVAGDYGKFDKRMAAPFILSAFNILERLAAHAGWPDEDLRFIRCIAQDTAFPCIDFNGDLIEIQGNPSGHPLTVIINCLVNSLYMRYAYLLISGKSLDTFQENVHLATYGDDNIMGISENCPKFNHTRIAEAMKIIGVEYTMAEKEAESVPYIHISQSSFLKRAFKYDKDIGCIVAPLDESSFHKMLTARLPKDDMAPEAHAICVIETAQREYFFHGKDIFFERQQFFHQLVKDCGLQPWVRDSTFPDYYDMVYDFWMRFDDEENALKYSLREQTRQTRVIDATSHVGAEKTVNRPEVLSTEWA